MFTRIIKVGNKYRIKSWFWPIANYLCDSGIWWQVSFYVDKYCNFDSIEDAESAWGEYSTKQKLKKTGKKETFIKRLK